MLGSHNHNFRNFFFFPNQAAKAVLHKQALHTRHDAVVWRDLFQNHSLHQHFRKTSTFPHIFKCWLKLLIERKTNLVQSPNYGLFFWTGSFEICLGPTLKAHCYSDHPFGFFWQDSAASRVAWHLLHGWNWGVLLPGWLRSLCIPQVVWRKQFHPQLEPEPGTRHSWIAED